MHKFAEWYAKYFYPILGITISLFGISLILRGLGIIPPEIGVVIGLSLCVFLLCGGIICIEESIKTKE